MDFGGGLQDFGLGNWPCYNNCTPQAHIHAAWKQFFFWVASQYIHHPASILLLPHTPWIKAPVHSIMAPRSVSVLTPNPEPGAEFYDGAF